MNKPVADFDSLEGFFKLWKQCESPIECRLLYTLYPRLDEEARVDLVLQYAINSPLIVTRLDFAFRELKIAIYCDGYEYHKDHDSFARDRYNSRILQFDRWFVLRFAGVEINNDIDSVVFQILMSIYMQRKALGIDCPAPSAQNNWLYYFGRGLYHFIVGNFGEAILDFTQAINLNPDCAEAYYQRGRAHVKKRNFEKSREDWERAIKMDPNLAAQIQMEMS